MEILAELHPKFVHFPIALLFTYILLEIIGAFRKNDFFSNAAYVILILGIIGAIAAVLTGNQAEEVLEVLEEQGAIVPFGTLDDHENYANITLWFFTVLAAARTFFFIKKKFTGKIKFLFVVLALVGGFFIYKTAEEGGELVYKHGVGTELFNADE